MVKLKTLPMLAGVVALGTVGLIAASAIADVISPDFNMFVCSGCTTPPSPADPNFINPGNFSIGIAGNHSTGNPVLVLIGEPGSPATAPTLSLPTGVTADATQAKFYGLPVATTGTAMGANEGTLTTGQEAYGQLNLAGTNNSQSFVNWTTSPFPNGQPNPLAGTNSFTLYAVALDFSPALTQGAVSGFDLEHGTQFAFVFAYGCTTVPTTVGNQCDTTGDNVGATPFTQTGFVPAPVIGHGIFVLLAIGGVLGGARLLETLKKSQFEAA
jgi:hypothetical protein